MSTSYAGGPGSESRGNKKMFQKADSVSRLLSTLDFAYV